MLRKILFIGVAAAVVWSGGQAGAGAGVYDAPVDLPGTQQNDPFRHYVNDDEFSPQNENLERPQFLDGEK